MRPLWSQYTRESKGFDNNNYALSTHCVAMNPINSHPIDSYFPDCYITEGKYMNQLDKIQKFRVILSPGTPRLGALIFAGEE